MQLHSFLIRRPERLLARHTHEDWHPPEQVL